MASPDDLKFQEFEEASDLLSSNPGASTLSISSPNSAGSSGEVRVDLSEDEDNQQEGSELLTSDKKTGGFWTFDYYQSFFDVDTVQVLDRIKGSVMPLPGRNFVKHHIRSNPDLYGPFWICVTLVFTLAISGNLSTFLNEMGNPEYQYRPQFHRVSIAAVTVFLYAWLVPVGVWGFLKWRQSVERQMSGYTFLETVCVYGYSLFIYIPTSILWAFPWNWLQWLLIAVAMVISGSLLVITFWPAVRDDTKLTAFATIAVIVALHALLAVGCKVRMNIFTSLLFPHGRKFRSLTLWTIYDYTLESYNSPMSQQMTTTDSLKGLRLRNEGFLDGLPLMPNSIPSKLPNGVSRFMLRKGLPPSGCMWTWEKLACDR
ncbi:hypothetical protein DNTS_028794 [Danionella cerebrum]|uniref:Protein YIPF n=1 Tax=Danionella cerebrum TaxID=2873325 RepID=A0A553NMT5_9TELE|nr:hypothetical protein DNTS_028794 [Danionella translucida]